MSGIKKYGSEAGVPYRFVLFGLLLCAIIFTVEHINGRFNLNDFKVYYLAARALVNGEQVYGLAFGLDTGFYKYSPFTLLLFVPYTLVSFEVARVLHFFVLSCCAIGAILLLRWIINRYLFEVRGGTLLLFAILACVLVHLVRELHLGNINIVLVLLVSMAVLFTLQGRALAAGSLFALVMVTKPYFLLLLLPLLAHQKGKTLLRLFLFIGIFLAIPAVFLGFSGNVALHREWASAMLGHGGYLTSTNTLEYLVQQYVYPVQGLQKYSIALTGLLYALFFRANKRAADQSRHPAAFNDRSFIVECFLLMAVIPNLVVTDTEHFLYSLPLITLLVCFLYLERSRILTASFVALIFLYGGNSSDLLGRELSRQFNEWGLLGISNLLIIAAAVLLYMAKREEWGPEKRETVAAGRL